RLPFEVPPLAIQAVAVAVIAHGVPRGRRELHRPHEDFFVQVELDADLPAVADLARRGRARRVHLPLMAVPRDLPFPLNSPLVVLKGYERADRARAVKPYAIHHTGSD